MYHRGTMNDSAGYESTEKEYLRARVQAALDTVHELQGQVQDLSNSYFARLLGQRFEIMLASRDATVGALSDPDPKVRQGAFSLVADHWGPDAASEHLYRRVAFSDPNMNVRAAALHCLVRLHHGSMDRDLSRLLANVAKDPKNLPSLRGTAYLGLLTVQGIEASNALKLALLRWEDGSAIPTEIDLSFVATFVPE
jgi:hypothetical protein